MNRQEIVLRRESYFKDAAFLLVVSGAMFWTNAYYQGISNYSFAVLTILLLYTLKSYVASVTISESGIAGKFLLSSWSFHWSEIRLWHAVEDTDCNRIIRFRAGKDGKIYTLPTDVVDESRYRLTEEFFRKHCGAPRKSDSWLYSDRSSDD